ncbi:MipA/OmpV family protein, partial [Guyparkeria sp. 1SP6A2]|nr:MipA/OmpV family protein [Guyparkeria sp. 1SP6A2]
ATDMGGGFRSIGINYNYRHYVNDNWQIYGEALYEHFSSAVRKSPIARGDFEAEVGIGFIYVF